MLKSTSSWFMSVIHHPQTDNKNLFFFCFPWMPSTSINKGKTKEKSKTNPFFPLKRVSCCELLLNWLSLENKKLIFHPIKKGKKWNVHKSYKLLLFFSVSFHCKRDKIHKHAPIETKLCTNFCFVKFKPFCFSWSWRKSLNLFNQKKKSKNWNTSIRIFFWQLPIATSQWLSIFVCFFFFQLQNNSFFFFTTEEGASSRFFVLYNIFFFSSLFVFFVYQKRIKWNLKIRSCRSILFYKKTSFWTKT